MEKNYYYEFINFFKKHNLYNKEMFEYINRNSTKIDYHDEEQRAFIGCYYICNKQNILQKIKICVPFIDSPITVLINIHEYLHAIELYNKIGKTYKNQDTKETLPMLYEQLYFEENRDKKLEEHLKYLNKKIKNDSDKSYKIALAIQKELLSYYKETSPTLEKLQKQAKKLSKKYQRDNDSVTFFRI